MRGRKLIFRVSGKLWSASGMMSLLMEDTETKSLWSQILGKAVLGPLKGTELRTLPSTITTWQDWRKNNPNGQVLNMKPTARAFTRSIFKNPRRFCVGLVLRGVSRAWSFDRLLKKGYLNDWVGQEPVLVLFNRRSWRFSVWSRKLRRQTLRFEPGPIGFLVEVNTGAILDPFSGSFKEGKLKGLKLKPLPAIISYTSAWKAFHPESSFYPERSGKQAEK